MAAKKTIRATAAKIMGQESAIQPYRPVVTSHTPKIAYILLWFPEPSQTFILDEVNTLVSLGLDVRVYTLYGPRPAALLRGMTPPAATVHHLGLAALNKILKSLGQLVAPEKATLRRFLRRVLVRRWRSWETAGEACWAALAGVHLAVTLVQAHITHIHAPWANGPATAAWVASRLSGIPFSFCAHAHDLYPPDGALTEKLAAAAFVRTISQRNWDFMAQSAPEFAAKLVKISYGAPLRGQPGPPRPFQPPYRLLALGRFVPKKGFPILLEACRRLVDAGLDVHLTLAGDGPLRHQLQRQADHLGLPGQVAFPGFVPHREVPQLLQQADLFVMPCIIDKSGDRDGLPNVILEAMAFAVPVVATDVNGVPEAVRDGDTGWLAPPGDAAALAHVIRQALADPAEARRRALAGHRLVREQFDSTKNYALLKTYLEKFTHTTT